MNGSPGGAACMSSLRCCSRMALAARPLACGGSPEPAGKFVLRVDCGASESYKDKFGNVWAADQELETGKTWGAVYGSTLDRPDVGITGTEIPRIYETERYSMDSYKFTVPNGKYTVRLHFAEAFDGITDAEGEGLLRQCAGPGSAEGPRPVQNGRSAQAPGQGVQRRVRGQRPVGDWLYAQYREPPDLRHRDPGRVIK